jgi:hypothetical protein
MSNVIRRLLVVTFVAAAVPSASRAQEAQQPGGSARTIAWLAAEPTSVSMQVGRTVAVRVTAYDSAGVTIPGAPLRLTGPRAAFAIEGQQVRALRAGRYDLVASAASSGGGEAPVTLRIPVNVAWPPIASISIEADSGRLYTGVTLQHRVSALHADGSARPRPEPRWSSSNSSVATVDRFGNVTALQPGSTIIAATIDGVRAERRYVITANPVARISIDIPQTVIRTGDAVELRAVARATDTSVIADVPIAWSYTYLPDDSVVAPGAAGVIDQGYFAGEVPGRYTLMATAGNAVARKVLDVRPRDVRRRFTVTGRGNINHVHTSDLWPWTGRDGRDYALVGTWGGDGWAYVFDITDLTNLVKTDSIQVDARVVNDVTVSPDGRYGVLSREGASNRVNGVVILDLADPAHPVVASTFDQELTGGVHNMFATDDYLFAISGGQKYVIVDVRDIYNPRYAGEYYHPDAYVHDIWVSDGIAYSSQWGVGLVAVDVGNGRWGGSIENPVLINTFPTTSGATHEVFPYQQASTGKTYLFLGDEIMSRQGRVWEGTSYFNAMTAPGGVAQTSAGYTHILDFTDPANPRNVARYHVEEFGSHDIIVEDDVMYQAYYDGGVRIVDVSGPLIGNLARQGREIAVFKPYDPEGFTPNAPFVMNAMPWKGHVLFTDFNTGLWSGKLEPRRLTP